MGREYRCDDCDWVTTDEKVMEWVGLERVSMGDGGEVHTRKLACKSCAAWEFDRFLESRTEVLGRG